MPAQRVTRAHQEETGRLALNIILKVPGVRHAWRVLTSPDAEPVEHRIHVDTLEVTDIVVKGLLKETASQPYPMKGAKQPILDYVLSVVVIILYIHCDSSNVLYFEMTAPRNYRAEYP